MKGTRHRRVPFFIPAGHVVVLTSVLAACITTSQAAQPRLSLTKMVDLPHAGLKIRLMPSAREIPLRMPIAYQYRNTSTSEPIEMYTMRDLWLREQHLGRWSDEHDNSLWMAKVDSQMPEDAERKRVLAEHYRDGERTRPTKWTPESLRVWLGDLTGNAVFKKVFKVKHPTRLRNAYMLQLHNQQETITAYVFQFRHSPQWFAAIFRLNPEADQMAARRTIEKKFIATITLARTSRTGTGNETPSSKFQNFRLHQNRERASDFKTSRDAVISSIRNLKNWWYVETPNYILVSDLTSKHRTFVRQLQTDLEYLRAAYAFLIPPRVDIDAVSVVRVFASPQDYIEYVPAEVEWTSGVWAPARKELVIKQSEQGKTREQRRSSLRVAYHEAFHQYLHYALAQRPVAMWFNEGHADFFAGCTIRGRRLTTDENAWRTETLGLLIDAGAARIGDVLMLSQAEFYGADVPEPVRDKVRDRNYTIAWALTYFLRKATLLREYSAYRTLADDYTDAVWDTQDPMRASEITFAQVDMKQLQQDFETFWKSKSARSKAKRLRLFTGRRK
tara:strand:- start:9 stop:1685 length:1677 start_codon:yes stop_codon:yes gene_type:complete